MCELNSIIQHLQMSSGSGAIKILEIGAGAGWQSKQLQDLGYSVFAVDLPSSNYKEVQMFPIREYDGINIPFENNSFDIVFSSNVLEHVEDIGSLFIDIARVLKPDGICIHLMPSSLWRFATIITSIKSYRIILSDAIKRFVFFPRHGVKGNALTELVTFNKYFWVRKIKGMKWDVLSVRGAGVFYTGYSLLGSNFSIKNRILLSKIIGSSCYVYLIKPRSKNIE